MVDVTPLVSTQWLATQLNDPQLRVIDMGRQPLRRDEGRHVDHRTT